MLTTRLTLQYINERKQNLTKSAKFSLNIVFSPDFESTWFNRWPTIRHPLLYWAVRNWGTCYWSSPKRLRWNWDKKDEKRWKKDNKYMNWWSTDQQSYPRTVGIMVKRKEHMHQESLTKTPICNIRWPDIYIFKHICLKNTNTIF